MQTSITVKKIASLDGHRDSIYALSTALEDGYFYSAGGDGIIAKWNTKQLLNAEMLVKVPSSVYNFQLFHQHKKLLIATRSGGIHVVNLATGVEEKLLQASNAAVFALASSTKEKSFFSGDADGNLYHWELPSLNLLHKLKISDASIRCLSLSPDEKTLAIGSSDFHIRLLDLTTFSIKKQLEGHFQSVFCLQWTSDSRLLSGGRDAHLREWFPFEDDPLATSLPAHWYTINKIIPVLNGKYLASASRDKTIKIWDMKTLELKKVIDLEKKLGHSHSVNSLLWLEEVNLLISAGDDKKIMVWRLDSTEV